MIPKTVVRSGDMDPKAALCLHLQEDGDIQVWIGNPFFPKGGMDSENTVEFCTIAQGGGRSGRTLDALRNLINAMVEDNWKNPIGNSVTVNQPDPERIAENNGSTQEGT